MANEKTKIEAIEQVKNPNIIDLPDGSKLKKYPSGEGLLILANGFKKSLTAEEVAALAVK